MKAPILFSVLVVMFAATQAFAADQISVLLNNRVFQCVETAAAVPAQPDEVYSCACVRGQAGYGVAFLQYYVTNRKTGEKKSLKSLLKFGQEPNYFAVNEDTEAPAVKQCQAYLDSKKEPLCQ